MEIFLRTKSKFTKNCNFVNNFLAKGFLLLWMCSFSMAIRLETVIIQGKLRLSLKKLQSNQVIYWFSLKSSLDRRYLAMHLIRRHTSSHWEKYSFQLYQSIMSFLRYRYIYNLTQDFFRLTLPPLVPPGLLGFFHGIAQWCGVHHGFISLNTLVFCLSIF